MSEGDVLHPCPIAGCRVKRLPFDRLMCAWHWRQVPSSLQRKVYRYWNNGQILDGYWAVREEAINAAGGPKEAT